MSFFVYILATRWNGTLYVGMTDDLSRRVWEHRAGSVPGFTKKYNCHLLVYFEIFDEMEQAIAREKQIKGWTRKKKNALVETMNPKWRDLAADWYAAGNAGDPSLRSG